MGTGAAITMGVSSLAGAYSQSRAIQAQDEFQRQQAAANQRLAALNAQDALRKGDLAAGKVKSQASRIQGSQRAAFVGQGVETGSGSAQDIQNETADYADIDMQTIKNNAWREAWGYRVEALNIAGQSKLRSIGAKAEATNTLLSGGLKALSSFAMAKEYYDENKRRELETPINTTNYREGVDDASKTTPKSPDEPKRMIASERDRIVEERTKRRSKENPLFPGQYLTSSWWVS